MIRRIYRRIKQVIKEEYAWFKIRLNKNRVRWAR